MLKSLSLTLKTRREQKRIAEATKRVQERQEMAHRFMMELSAAGYEIVKTSTP